MKTFVFAISFCFFSLLIANMGICFADTNHPSLKYLGTAFVKIKTSEGITIFIDPYLVSDPDSADIVLITHEHNDHNDLTRLILKPTCRVIRVADAIINLVYQNFTIGNIKIKAVAAYGDQWHPQFTGVGFVVEFDSMKVYHAGGTSLIPEMADLASQKINYSILTMVPGPVVMTQAASVIQAKHDIPVHTNDPFILAQFASPNRLILIPGETIELTNDTIPHIGANLRVPQDYPSIQTAIDAAQNSDTVLVSEGTYYENINYKGKGIVVTSRYGITKDWQTVQNTIINGSAAPDKNSASTVQFLYGEDSTAVLDGFTITGGTGTRYTMPFGPIVQHGAGIILNQSSAIIRNNYIVYNTVIPQTGVREGGGGGIGSLYSNPTIYNNVIVSNIASYAGGVLLDFSRGIVRNNIICHNFSISGDGGGIQIWQPPPDSVFIENNTIISNYSELGAGGISISVISGAPSVKNNIVWGNGQNNGGQITSPEYIAYNNVENYSSGTNFSLYPVLQEGSFLLSATSPCIDAGDPATPYNDIEDPLNVGMALSPSKGTLRNDMGAFGGLSTKLLPSLDIFDIHVSRDSINMQCLPGNQENYDIELRNLGSRIITIDSVTHINTSTFSLNKNITGQYFNLFTSDSIKVTFRSETWGKYSDTIKLFHNAPGIINPVKITVTGIANTPLYLNKPIPAQTAIIYQLFTFQIPDSTFLDDDIGDKLSYQASGLPSWLSFNPSTRTFQGTPLQTTSSPLNINITVKDSLQASASTTFQLSVVQQVANNIYTLSAGWSLVSIPSLQSNYDANMLFPDKDGDMYSFNTVSQSYVVASTLVNGLGYWIHNQMPDTLTLSGYIVGPLNITTTRASWVLLGSHESDLRLSSLILTNGATIVGDIAYSFHQSQGYVPISIIKPGEGCWIYVDRACTITVP